MQHFGFRNPDPDRIYRSMDPDPDQIYRSMDPDPDQIYRFMDPDLNQIYRFMDPDPVQIYRFMDPDPNGKTSTKTLIVPLCIGHSMHAQILLNSNAEFVD